MLRYLWTGHVGIELDDSDAENSQVTREAPGRHQEAWISHPCPQVAAQAPQANVPDARLERPRAGGKRQRVKSAEEEHEVVSVQAAAWLRGCELRS